MDLRKNAYKGVVLIVLFCSLLFYSQGTQAAYQTNLLAGIYLQDGSGVLDVGNWSAPTVYDWNSDGAKDLIVGRKGLDNIGYVSFYENYGTDASPVFNGYIDIQTCSDPCFAAG